nr:DUF4145 domain-containing protein [uncultured Flavobacterium sp.]
MTPFTPPKLNESAFNCPHCGAYSNQNWSQTYSFKGGFVDIDNLLNSICTHCREFTLWYKGKLIFPSVSGAPLPNIDLPEDIKIDFEEARIILNTSPRGSAALLRLCIQKLCGFLGESGKDINNDIGSLVKKGLSSKIQQSLDIVRVIGNDAVHPGQIDLKDDVVTATKLFILVNIIADVMITQPNEIESIFNSLPKNKIDGIKTRDLQK